MIATAISAHDDILVVWKQPQTRERFVIGRLWHDEERFYFQYERSMPRSLVDAEEAGFRRFRVFDSDEVVASEHLFPVFRRRIPESWSREDLDSLVDQTDLGEDQLAFQILKLTGGRLATDTLEFLEPVATDEDQGCYEVRFPIAGWRHYAGELVISDMTVGSSIVLEVEPDNDWDVHAVRILSQGGVHIGYVPAVFSWYLADFVERGAYEAIVDDIRGIDDPQRRVRVFLRAQLDIGTQQYKPIPARLTEFADQLYVTGA